MRITNINSLRLLGAIGVVLGSFFATLAFIDYRDQSIANVAKIVRGTELQWKAEGQATFDVNGQVVTMRGPNFIYAETDCLHLRCSVSFSIEVIRTSPPVNIGLMFLRSTGAHSGEQPFYTLKASEKFPMVEANAPDGTSRIRAFIYSPTREAQVVFKEPVLVVKPEVVPLSGKAG